MLGADFRPLANNDRPLHEALEPKDIVVPLALVQNCHCGRRDGQVWAPLRQTLLGYEEACQLSNLRTPVS